jgi:hypothetical protein
MRRFPTLLLALFATLALTMCSKDPPDRLYGTWVVDVDRTIDGAGLLGTALRRYADAEGRIELTRERTWSGTGGSRFESYTLNGEFAVGSIDGDEMTVGFLAEGEIEDEAFVLKFDGNDRFTVTIEAARLRNWEVELPMEVTVYFRRQW